MNATPAELMAALEMAKLMRGAQRQFFRNREPEMLLESRRLETAFDKTAAILLPVKGSLL